MLFQIALVILLAMLNGFFTLGEMALMVSRASRLKHKALTSSNARVALELIQKPEQFLATIQVFITLIGIGTGTALGAAIGERVALWINGAGYPAFAEFSIPLGVVVSVSGITFVNMLLGELLPKRLALVDPERIATSLAWPMRILIWMATPFAFVLIRLTRLLLRLLRVHSVHREHVSEDEIRLLVSEGAEQGVIDADERNMVNRVLRLGDRTVDSLMTPRTRIAWLDAAASLEENLGVLRDMPNSRYPVYREGEHDILGILEIKRVFGRMAAGETPDLFTALAKPLYVPANARALDLLEEFREAETPMALVVDEYGDIEGLVTLNDLLAAVLGRAATTMVETEDAPIVQRDDGSWLIDGAVSVEDLRELLAIDRLPNEEDHDYHTIAGMVMARFGRIPNTGEHFPWAGYRFEVVDLDGARIDKLLVSRLPDNEIATDS